MYVYAYVSEISVYLHVTIAWIYIADFYNIYIHTYMYVCIHIHIHIYISAHNWHGWTGCMTLHLLLQQFLYLHHRRASSTASDLNSHKRFINQLLQHIFFKPAPTALRPELSRNRIGLPQHVRTRNFGVQVCSAATTALL